MTKPIILILLLLSLARPLLAQTTPLPPVAAAPATAASRGDTIRAVGHLFERRRAGGKNWLYVSLSGLLGVVRVLTSPTTTTVGGYQTRSEVDGGAAATFGVVFLGLPVAIGVGKLTRFSEKRETEITSAYATGQPLPRAIARRLRRKDF